MKQSEKMCCSDTKDRQRRGVLPGIVYGLIPHSFCLAFIGFSIVGAATATAFLKKFLLIPQLFAILVIVSLLLATVSSVIYLKKTGCFCASGIRNKWRYILLMYSTTILANLLMFFVVLPALVNMNSQRALAREAGNARENRVEQRALAKTSITVQIPCTGHAPLIIDEVKKDEGVVFVNFQSPDKFEISYDPLKTSPEKIVALEIFKTYEAKIN